LYLDRIVDTGYQLPMLATFTMKSNSGNTNGLPTISRKYCLKMKLFFGQPRINQASSQELGGKRFIEKL
jgi:hypothetical protein